jgi:hypothetical protein
LVISISPLPSSCKLVNVDAMLLEMLLWVVLHKYSIKIVKRPVLRRF